MLTGERWRRTPLYRFLIAGGSNTLITGALVVILSYFIPGSIAFSVAFAFGVGYALVLTGRWVFNSRLTRSRVFLFIASYLAIYLCGLSVVALIGALDLPPWANASSVFVTAPLSYLAGRFIFSRSNTRGAPAT